MASLAHIPRIWVVALGVAAAALIAAFALLPEFLLGKPDAVLDPLVPSLSAFWDSGNGTVPPALTDLVGYWREWHAIKVLISALLLAVAVAMTLIMWSRYRAAQRAGGIGNAVGGTISTVFSVVAGGLLALNIQATAVPLVALFPLVPVSSDDASMSQSLAQLRESLAHGQAPFGHETVHQLIVEQVWEYTVVNAVVMAALAMIAGALAIVLLVRFLRSHGNRRTRVMCAATGPLLGVFALACLAISALSALSAVDASSTAAGLLGG